MRSTTIEVGLRGLQCDESSLLLLRRRRMLLLASAHQPHMRLSSGRSQDHHSTLFGCLPVPALETMVVEIIR